MTEIPPSPATKEEPFLVESETVNAIRARAPLEAIILDLMLIDGRAVVTDMTPDEVREGIKARYEVDPYEHANRPQASKEAPSIVPYVAGIYSTADVAKIIAGRLIDAGFPVLVEQFPEAPPDVDVIGTPEGQLVQDHQGPVWVIRTGYGQPQ
ncbi:MAG: hypothetical protein LUQ37_00930 [Methanoregulaceae archaeon]|jgi:hypothetical protein|nr:hypothetical protein [Methanoregulaceae archaeon]